MNTHTVPPSSVPGPTSPLHQVVAGPPPPPWSWARLLAFRFGFLLAFQVVFPFPLGVVPKTEWLAEVLAKPWDWAIQGGSMLLGVAAPENVVNGSGDTSYDYATNAVILVVAALGALAWTALDRRRRAHPRLAAGVVIALRYYLAFALITYGFAKLSQFPAPGPTRLDERVGEMSPMGMLWTFMGSSQAYTLFAGVAEAAGGFLLLWRRTTVLGALLAAAVLTNIVALNLCYDVPVKLFSAQLLIIAIALVLPHARRLLAAVLGHATAATPGRAPLARRWARLRLVAKLALLGCGAYQLQSMVRQSLEWRVSTEHELAGAWIVDRHLVDGVDLAATAPASRWSRVTLDSYHGRIRTLGDSGTYVTPLVYAESHTLSLRTSTAGQMTTDKYQYTLDATANPTTLVLEGTWHDRPLRIELHKDAPPLLTTRGFHWVNEYPFNR